MRTLILVIGSDGMVGSRFVELSMWRNFLYLPKETELDITDSEAVKKMIEDYTFNAVVNFREFTDISEGELQRGNRDKSCWRVNFVGVKNLVDAIKPYRFKIHFIQISTDMVFSGNQKDQGPYSEDHPIETDSKKLTWYGYSKAEAERYILSELEDFATILRVNYPVRAEFNNELDLLRKYLKLFDERGLHPLFRDQQISISFIDDISRALDKIISQKKTGIFHSSSENTTSPYDLASYLIEKTRGQVNKVRATTIGNYLDSTGESSLIYPQFGGLRVDETESQLGVAFSDWKSIVKKLTQQGISY